MPIKPEDVTDNHIKQIKDYLEGQIGWPLMPDNAQLATLANALIEAGIVSPPVWCFRYEDGSVADRDDTREPLIDIAIRSNLFDLSSRVDLRYGQWRAEHWKGQTE